VRDDVVQVQRLGQELEPALVEAGEDEQVVDRARHPIDLLARALEDPARCGRQVVGAQADVDLRAHRRQRRAQLVGGIGDQAVLLLDALPDAVEHRVQRGGQVRDLVAGVRDDEAVVDAIEVDGRGAGGHAVDRAQRPLGKPPAAERRGQQSGRTGDEEQDEDAAHRPVDARHRLGRDGHVPLSTSSGRARDEPKALVGAAELDGLGQLAAAQHRGRVGAREHRRPGHRIADRHRHAARWAEDLSRRALAGEHAARDVDGLGRAFGAIAVGDLGGGGMQRAIDGVGEIGAQPQHEERAHDDDDGREQDHVPRRHARADRQPHGPASSAYPTPRIVRMSGRSNGCSSFLRR
jgi:hypothetical protein